MLISSSAETDSQEYAAEIRARTELRLGFQVGGKLVSRQAAVGQHVQAGQVLARLDPEDLRLSQAAGQAAVRTAQVNADLMRADFKRFKDLREQGFISSAELERRETGLQAALAQLAQAKAQAAVQSNQAAYTSLVTTQPGVVLAVDAEPGAVLSAGTPVLRLAVDGPRDVVFAVPEDQASGLQALLAKPGALTVKMWADGQDLRATVRELAAAADPVTRTFLVKAEVGKPQPKLGQTARVSIERPSDSRLISLPLTAVKEHAGRSTVWVVAGNPATVRSRAVAIAGARGNDLLIGQGLLPGERVVTAGVHVLTEGQAVRLLASDVSRTKPIPSAPTPSTPAASAPAAALR